MQQALIETEFNSADIDVRDSSFTASIYFKGQLIHVTGNFSFDGCFPEITCIEFLDSEDNVPDVGIVDQKELRILFEVELNERYQTEMYLEWEKYNGPDEYGDY